MQINLSVSHLSGHCAPPCAILRHIEPAASLAESSVQQNQQRSYILNKLLLCCNTSICHTVSLDIPLTTKHLQYQLWFPFWMTEMLFFSFYYTYHLQSTWINNQLWITWMLFLCVLSQQSTSRFKSATLRNVKWHSAVSTNLTLTPVSLHSD